MTGIKQLMSSPTSSRPIRMQQCRPFDPVTNMFPSTYNNTVHKTLSVQRTHVVDQPQTLEKPAAIRGQVEQDRNSPGKRQILVSTSTARYSTATTKSYHPPFMTIYDHL